MNKFFRIVLLSLPMAFSAVLGAEQYNTVDALWQGYNPRALPIDAKVLNETKDGGLVIRTVQYTVEVSGTFTARMVAYYGFPEGAKKLPTILHVHGGGQNAVLAYVKYWAAQGYAAMSIDWGGKPLENNPGKGQTDWGPLQVNQNDIDSKNVFKSNPDSRSNSWYHWTIGIRRSITFLEQQPEVDPTRIGVYGISMGGRLQWMLAGTDDRPRCVTSIYGASMMDGTVPGVPDSVYIKEAAQNPYWHNTLDSSAYAPRIKVPFLFLAPTNDFFARMDFVEQTLDTVPADHCWRSFAPHYNHTFDIDHSATLVRWMAYWLKGEGSWPKPPTLEAKADRAANAIAASVSPDQASNVQKVIFLYATGIFSEGRFWRTVDSTGNDGHWSADLPLTVTDKSVRVFANILYKDGETLSTPVTIVTPAQLQAQGITPSDPPTLVVDDFHAGARDWYILNVSPNPLLGEVHNYTVTTGPNSQPAIMRNEKAGERWNMATHKIGDPKWHAPAGAGLAIQVRADKPGSLVVAISKNDGRKPLPAKIYTATAQLKGGEWETASFPLENFKSPDDNSPMSNWDDTNLLVICGHYFIPAKGSKKPLYDVGEPWQGAPPAISSVKWVPKS